MLIRIVGDARVTHDNGEVITSRSIIRRLNGAGSSEECSNYLDSDLADLGLAGGRIKLRYEIGEGRYYVVTEYTSPIKLNPAQLRKLAEGTIGQWSDGIGEHCFDELAEQLGVSIDLTPPGQGVGLRIEQVDKGKGETPRIFLAKAARDGDMPSLRKYLDAGTDLEARLQGYTPLHLAILYGRAEAALELIAHGADVNSRDLQDTDPLLLTALSNSISDEDAAKVAQSLLERGASVHGSRGPNANPESGEFTPIYIALNRKKTRMVAVLRQFGATR